MLDLNHLPKPQNGYIDYFYSTGTSWVTWEKPRGISMIHITCFGAGAGGAGGGASGNGGSGGGSGGQTTLLIPAYVLPDILYVSVGRGGAGGITNPSFPSIIQPGSDGSSSVVSIAQSTDAIYVVCFANGGSGSTNGGAFGAAQATSSNALMSFSGFFFALAGQDGGFPNSANITYPTTGLLVSGGAGGGNVNFLGGSGVGGSILVPTQSAFSIISSIAGANFPNNGSSGLTILQPLMSTGGAGGAGTNTNFNNNNNATNGGDGGFGSGGGAGGLYEGNNGFLNGKGGKGGDGLVIIQSF